MSKKIKVAHIITRLELGGAQQNTLYCCAHHDRKKYEVLLVCGEGGYLDGVAKRIPGCKTYLLPELKHPISPLWDRRALDRITEILREEKVDLVHTHSSKAGILGRVAARRAGVKAILHTIHGWGFYPGQFFPIKWLYQTLERWAATFTNILIAVSRENMETGLKAGIGRPDQYRVIHSGIDPKLYRLLPSKTRRVRKNEDRPTVLILANYKKQKSPFEVVEIAQALVPKVPEVLFLWAGDGPLKKKVQRLIDEKGLDKNFRLLGWRDDVSNLLGVCDVLLLTSIYEGLPRVVLQAMAAGKPVVATAVSGTPEAVHHGVTGFLHLPGEARPMADSLAILLKDPAKARQMGQAGNRALKGTFLIKEMLKEIEKNYQEALRS